MRASERRGTLFDVEAALLTVEVQADDVLGGLDGVEVLGWGFRFRSRSVA